MDILKLCDLFKLAAEYEDDPEFYEGLAEIVLPEETDWGQEVQQGQQAVTELKHESGYGEREKATRSESEKTRRVKQKTEEELTRRQEDPAGYAIQQMQKRVDQYQNLIQDIKHVLVSGDDTAVVEMAITRFPSQADEEFAREKIDKQIAKLKILFRKTKDADERKDIGQKISRLRDSTGDNLLETAFGRPIMEPDSATRRYTRAKLRSKIPALQRAVEGLREGIESDNPVLAWRWIAANLRVAKLVVLAKA